MEPIPPKLILATNNVHKIRELRAMLKSISLDVLTISDFPHYQAPEETGHSFEENAVLKATHAASVLQAWTLGDDSGLVIPALKGAPGIYTARFAGKDATDADNRKKLLEEMHHLLEEDRFAFFECCLVLASPKGVEKIAKGVCEGTILFKEKGGSGFGYDPLFIKHGYNKSYGELSEAVKNRISHRRKAFEKLLPSLQAYAVSE